MFGAGGKQEWVRWEKGRSGGIGEGGTQRRRREEIEGGRGIGLEAGEREQEEGSWFLWRGRWKLDK